MVKEELEIKEGDTGFYSILTGLREDADATGVGGGEKRGEGMESLKRRERGW